MVQWEATDQFGNLFVLSSKSKDVRTLRAELTSLIDQMRERNQDDYQLTVDFSYSEINGPDPENVSHVLQVEWLADCLDHTSTLLEMQDTVADICTEKGWKAPEVVSA